MTRGNTRICIGPQSSTRCTRLCLADGPGGSRTAADISSLQTSVARH